MVRSIIAVSLVFGTIAVFLLYNYRDVVTVISLGCYVFKVNVLIPWVKRVFGAEYFKDYSCIKGLVISKATPAVKEIKSPAK